VTNKIKNKKYIGDLVKLKNVAHHAQNEDSSFFPPQYTICLPSTPPNFQSHQSIFSIHFFDFSLLTNDFFAVFMLLFGDVFVLWSAIYLS
jgi:hypothetical protein